MNNITIGEKNDKTEVKEWFIPYMISSGILILVGIVCVVYQLVNLWITALA